MRTGAGLLIFFTPGRFSPTVHLGNSISWVNSAARPGFPLCTRVRRLSIHRCDLCIYAPIRPLPPHPGPRHRPLRQEGCRRETAARQQKAFVPHPPDRHRHGPLGADIPRRRGHAPVGTESARYGWAKGRLPHLQSAQSLQAHSAIPGPAGRAITPRRIPPLHIAIPPCRIPPLRITA